MKNNQEEIKINNPIYWEDKMEAILKEVCVINNKIKNKNSKKIKTPHDYNIFEFASKEIIKDKNLMIKALDKGFIYFFEIIEELKNDIDFNLQYLKEVRTTYYYNLNNKVLENEDVFKLSIKKNAETFKLITSRSDYNLRKKYLNEEKIIEILILNPKVIQYLDVNWKKNINVVKKAIELDVKNYKHINKSICKKVFDKLEVVQELLSDNVDSYEKFEKINNKFFKNKDFLIEYLPKCPQIIRLINKKLKNDIDILKLAAPASNFLEHISDENKKNTELITKHLEHNPFNYKKLEGILNVKPIMMNLIKKEHYPYTYLNEEDKYDEDYIYAVLEHNEFYIKPDNTRYSFFISYQKVSILNILPEEVLLRLKEEIKEKYPTRYYTLLSEEDFLVELLSFAKDKYLNIYLNKNLKQKEIDYKKIKI